jgi:penicillin-binding protein 1B
VVQGGSTITQQLAKNLFLSPRRTPLRKVREAAIAVFLERRHSKEEILEAYLNEVYLGQDGGLAIHGVARAAEFYFQKDVSQLDLREAALLAGIIRGPSLYSPIRHPESAERRRNLVLEVMNARGVIDDDTFAAARKSPLNIADRRERTRSGRYFVDYVSTQLVEELGSDAVGGVTVFTTLDLELQRIAERAVNAGLTRLEREYPGLVREGSPLQAALVAIDPHTGQVLAMVGGRDYGASQFNRAVRARRQPGSSFKPIVALAALAQRDDRVTLATLLSDEPLSVSTPAGVWKPANYDGQFRGSVTLRDALERSLNVPFARLGLEVGPERIVATGRALGVDSDLHAVPSIALGASEVTPLEMARAYGVLSASGLRADIQTTIGVLDSHGNLVSRMEPEAERVFEPSVTYLVTSALTGAVERGTGRGLRRFGYRGPVAAKSGTTNDFRDAWFIGYTPSLALAVWVGFDDGRSIGVSGARAALPIFARFLKEAAGPDGHGEFDMPSGVEVVEVDAETGLRAGWGCRGRPEVFVRGTAPTRSCSPSWVSSRSARQWSRARDVLERAWRDQRRRSSRGRN